jgi:hypothetical protein
MNVRGLSYISGPGPGKQPPVLDVTEGIGAFLDIDFLDNSTNLDIGGGQYDDNTEWLLLNKRVQNFVYDIYARSPQHNQSVLARKQKYQSITIMSVLNVIPEIHERIAVLELAKMMISKDEQGKSQGVIYIRIYEGDLSGISIRSNASLYQQENRPTCSYLNEIRSVFLHPIVVKCDPARFLIQIQ